MCLGVVLFVSILFGTLCASWTWMSVLFTKLGKYSVIRNDSFFSIGFQFLVLSPPPGIPMMQMLIMLEFFPEALTLSSFYQILFFFLVFWLDVFASLYSKSLIWFLPSSTLLLTPCKLFFVSISVSFVSDWFFFMVSRSFLCGWSSLRVRLLFP